MAQQLSIDVYHTRAVAPDTLLQERLEYGERMAEARMRQLAATRS